MHSIAVLPHTTHFRDGKPTDSLLMTFISGVITSISRSLPAGWLSSNVTVIFFNSSGSIVKDAMR